MEGVYISSTELQNHTEALAMMGGRLHALVVPGVYDYLLRHVRETKRERAAACEKARLTREARWREIASGERPALSVLQLAKPVSTKRYKAAA